MTNSVSSNQETRINVEKEMAQPEQSRAVTRGEVSTDGRFDPHRLLAGAYPVATTVNVSAKTLNDN